MNKKLLALYGLKWNPFAPDVPVEALHVSRRIESFCWRVRATRRRGRLRPRHRRARHRQVGHAAHSRRTPRRAARRQESASSRGRRPASPTSIARWATCSASNSVPHNRWGGAKLLRDRWQTHIDAALSRPVLIVDEAQEMLPAVLAELRLLSSASLDSHILLTVVLAGDGRLLERLRSDELLPLGSRMRVRLALERPTPDELSELIVYAPAEGRRRQADDAGADRHARRPRSGQPARADEYRRRVARVAAQREARQIDEKLFLELCAAPPVPEAKTARQRR